MGGQVVMWGVQSAPLVEIGLTMEVSIDGEGTRFHFFISETKRDFNSFKR